MADVQKCRAYDFSTFERARLMNRFNCPSTPTSPQQVLRDFIQERVSDDRLVHVYQAIAHKWSKFPKVFEMSHVDSICETLQDAMHNLPAVRYDDDSLSDSDEDDSDEERAAVGEEVGHPAEERPAVGEEVGHPPEERAAFGEEVGHPAEERAAFGEEVGHPAEERASVRPEVSAAEEIRRQKSILRGLMNTNIGGTTLGGTTLGATKSGGKRKKRNGDADSLEGKKQGRKNPDWIYELSTLTEANIEEQPRRGGHYAYRVTYKNQVRTFGSRQKVAEYDAEIGKEPTGGVPHTTALNHKDVAKMVTYLEEYGLAGFAADLVREGFTVAGIKNLHTMNADDQRADVMRFYLQKALRDAQVHPGGDTLRMLWNVPTNRHEKVSAFKEYLLTQGIHIDDVERYDRHFQGQGYTMTLVDKLQQDNRVLVLEEMGKMMGMTSGHMFEFLSGVPHGERA